MTNCKCDKPDCQKCQVQKLEKLRDSLSSYKAPFRQLAVIKKPIRQLAAEDPIRKKTICLDFDGVISNYKGWKSADKLGEPIPGFREFLDEANREGYIVVIHSARNSDAIEAWLEEHNIPCPISIKKPMAHIYVDDNAMVFTGSYVGLLEKIKQHKPWWKNEEE